MICKFDKYHNLIVSNSTHKFCVILSTMKKEHKSNIIDGLKKAEWIVQNLPIVFFGDPLLKKTCIPFSDTEFDSKEMQELAAQLTQTIIEYRSYMGMGRGIAANQLGSNRRMIVLWLGESPEVMINPECVKLSGQGSYWESCMSSGNLIIGEVIRAWRGTFVYKDIKGKTKCIEADEKETRLFLHEIDHLNGQICIDQYTKGTTKFITGGKEEVFGYEFKELASKDI